MWYHYASHVYSNPARNAMPSSQNERFIQHTCIIPIMNYPLGFLVSLPLFVVAALRILSPHAEPPNVSIMSFWLTALFARLLLPSVASLNRGLPGGETPVAAFSSAAAKCQSGWMLP